MYKTYICLGTYGEWAGRQLIDTRITLRDSYMKLNNEKLEQKKLLTQIDELKLIQLKSLEYEEGLLFI